MWKPLTDALCIITVLLLSIYDLFPAFSRTDGDTISEAVQYAGHHLIIIPFLMAILLAHFFMPREQALLGQPNSVFLMTWCIWAVFVLGVGLQNIGLTTSTPWYSFLLINLGLLTGHYLWPLVPVN